MNVQYNWFLFYLLSYYYINLIEILILERIINCYCSNYISLWRTLLIEFYRNLNHSLNITTHAIDIGLFTTMLWKFEEREKLINLQLEIV